MRLYTCTKDSKKKGKENGKSKIEKVYYGLIGQFLALLLPLVYMFISCLMHPRIYFPYVTRAAQSVTRLSMLRTGLDGVASPKQALGLLRAYSLPFAHQPPHSLPAAQTQLHYSYYTLLQRQNFSVSIWPVDRILTIWRGLYLGSAGNMFDLKTS